MTFSTSLLGFISLILPQPSAQLALCQDFVLMMGRLVTWQIGCFFHLSQETKQNPSVQLVKNPSQQTLQVADLFLELRAQW